MSTRRLSQGVETALFRIVQAALINIHRHASSATTRIHWRVKGQQPTLEIAGHGRGMKPAFAAARLRQGAGGSSVGVAGMRERLQQFGGVLDITSSAKGTTVRALIPLPRTIQ
jgi:two-component system, NarL family, sensor kinase